MRKKDVIMISVQKELMIITKIGDNGRCVQAADDKKEKNDKNSCAEEVDNDEERSDNCGCAKEANDDDNKEERIDKTCSEKAE
jgi:hypothetical protein